MAYQITARITPRDQTADTASTPDASTPTPPDDRMRMIRLIRGRIDQFKRLDCDQFAGSIASVNDERTRIFALADAFLDLYGDREPTANACLLACFFWRESADRIADDLIRRIRDRRRPRH